MNKQQMSLVIKIFPYSIPIYLNYDHTTERYNAKLYVFLTDNFQLLYTEDANLIAKLKACCNMYIQLYYNNIFINNLAHGKFLNKDKMQVDSVCYSLGRKYL